MNKQVACVMVVLVAAQSAVFAGAGRAALGTANESKAARAILADARALGHDAAIYQWERVNDEVDRIEAAQKYITGSQAADVVSRMRSARLDHDVDGLVAAAKDLEDAVGSLAK